MSNVGERPCWISWGAAAGVSRSTVCKWPISAVASEPLSLYFAARGATVIGIDPIGSRLEVGRAVAAEHGLRAEFETGRMEALELDDASFDLAVQNNSLCYIVSVRIAIVPCVRPTGSCAPADL